MVFSWFSLYFKYRWCSVDLASASNLDCDIYLMLILCSNCHYWTPKLRGMIENRRLLFLVGTRTVMNIDHDCVSLNAAASFYFKSLGCNHLWQSSFLLNHDQWYNIVVPTRRMLPVISIISLSWVFKDDHLNVLNLMILYRTLNLSPLKYQIVGFLQLNKTKEGKESIIGSSWYADYDDKNTILTSYEWESV